MLRDIKKGKHFVAPSKEKISMRKIDFLEASNSPTQFADVYFSFANISGVKKELS